MNSIGLCLKTVCNCKGLGHFGPPATTRLFRIKHISSILLSNIFLLLLNVFQFLYRDFTSSLDRDYIRPGLHHYYRGYIQVTLYDFEIVRL